MSKKNTKNTTTVAPATTEAPVAEVAAPVENTAEVEVIATTKTVNPLAGMDIIKDGKVIDNLPITCPGQMWRELKGRALFLKYGDDVTIRAYRDNGEVYMEFVSGERKDGTKIMKQNIIANRRGQILKAQREAAKAAEAAAAPQVVAAPDSVKETPAEEPAAAAEA